MFILKLYHLYLIALIPVFAGLIMAVASNGKVTIKEWTAGVAGAFVCALLMHLFSWLGRTDDVETWSGQVISVTYEPSWVARWKETDYIKVPTGHDSNGNTTYTRVPCGSHWEYSHHNESYYVETSLGQTISVNRESAEGTANNLGGWVPQRWQRSNFYEGDTNRYLAVNKTGWVQPVTDTVHFENRAKAAPSRFSFKKIPDGVNVFEYPKNNNPFCSDRLVGTARNTFDLMEFDRLCARLGPAKRVNLIMVGFGDEQEDIASWQRSAWFGGKKNDLVICYGGSNPLHPSWVSVFGWGQEYVEKPLLDLLASATMDSSVLPKIEKIIVEKYRPVDWESLTKHIDIEMPGWSWIVMIGFILISQGGYYFWAWKNQFTDGM